jgi:NAD(P)-dependent dehydrogenase (short-subunit alcohol dehydrogenase family)
MRNQRSGKVVTITSTAGIIGQEFVAAYAASKFALEGWMESLRFDVAPYGISTTIVEPGFFRTELRWIAGADAVAGVEQKARDLLAQADAHRELSSSLDHDDA